MDTPTTNTAPPTPAELMEAIWRQAEKDFAAEQARAAWERS